MVRSGPTTYTPSLMASRMCLNAPSMPCSPATRTQYPVRESLKRRRLRSSFRIQGGVELGLGVRLARTVELACVAQAVAALVEDRGHLPPEADVLLEILGLDARPALLVE